ncbi:hypothetical protein Sjap_020953 [Stephania japonica]|uniref:Uncharacterized protein n=1 Tax=Stephania japonica TaxID=461633 RepID=A0AAP0F2K6_9MAGN
MLGKFTFKMRVAFGLQNLTWTLAWTRVDPTVRSEYANIAPIELKWDGQAAILTSLNRPKWHVCRAHQLHNAGQQILNGTHTIVLLVIH